MYYYVGMNAGRADVFPDRAVKGIEIRYDLVERFLAIDSAVSRCADGIYRLIKDDEGFVSYADKDRFEFANIVFANGEPNLAVCGCPEDYPGIEAEDAHADGEKWAYVGLPEGDDLDYILKIALGNCSKYGAKIQYYDPDTVKEGPEMDSWFDDFIFDLRSLPLKTQDYILGPIVSRPYPHNMSNIDIRAAIAAKPEFIDDMRKAFNSEKERVGNARSNQLDLLGNFHKMVPANQLILIDEDVEVRYSWDPLKIGTNVNAILRFGFFNESVHVSLDVKETVEEILSILGAPATYENIMKAMRTHDWYLHMEAVEDGITLIFHNLSNVYDFDDAYEMGRHLVKQFERYLEELRRNLASDTTPGPRIPGYN